MGSPTMGKAPEDVAAHRVAAALRDLRCVPLSRRTRGLRGPSLGADLTTQAARSNSLVTFGAVFPDAVRLMPLDVGTPSCLSWGCRRSPLRRSRCAKSTPGEDPCGTSPSGRRLPTPTVFRPCGFSPLRRLAPPLPCRDVAPGCRPWGSSRFRPLRGVIPATPICPSEPCSPDTASALDESRTWAAVRRGRCVTTPPPLHPRPRPPRR